MLLSKLTAIAAAVLVAATLAAAAIAQTAPAIVVDPAIATMTNDQLVEARQNAMKQDGGIMRSAGGLLGDDAIAATTTLLQNFTNFPALFREGSHTDKSKALPAVWERWDDFNAIFEEARLASSKALEAAQSGDGGLYADAIKAIGATCFECHQSFRGR